MCPVAHQNKPTPQQAATGDPISQQTHPPYNQMKPESTLRCSLTSKYQY